MEHFWDMVQMYYKLLIDSINIIIIIEKAYLI